MTKPRLLDLFCCAGGAGTGYHRAGFEVVGVDLNPQPHYPFEFVQADAMTFPLGGFDAVHASPPCQAYSVNMRHLAGQYPMLIDATRDRLIESRLPYVIENVEGAPVATGDSLFGDHGVTLCGSMFGLRIWRHRLFECSIPIVPPQTCNHSRWPLNPYHAASRRRDGIEKRSMSVYADAMGIDWTMTSKEVSEAIPPAYTQWIGSHLMEVLIGDATANHA